MQNTAYAELGGEFAGLETASYQEGVADFNGNYQIPLDGEKYILNSINHTESGDKYRYLGIKDGVYQNKGL